MKGFAAVFFYEPKEMNERSQTTRHIVAERGGFEPPIPEGIHDFESCAINRALPPLQRGLL